MGRTLLVRVQARQDVESLLPVGPSRRRVEAGLGIVGGQGGGAQFLHQLVEADAARSRQLLQALGGVGYTNEYATGRLWRDAKLYEIGAGTSEIRRMLIGRELFAETI